MPVTFFGEPKISESLFSISSSWMIYRIEDWVEDRMYARVRAV
jgi:hypothetical protein